MYGKNGRFYADPVTLDAAVVPITLVTADATKTAFALDGAKELVATLGIHAYYETALTGTNNDLVLFARAPAAGGKLISITYADPAANNAALGVVVTGNDIVVNLATGAAGAITSTSAQIKAALEASAAANALVLVTHSGTDTGAGVAIALAKTQLGEPVGSSPTMDVTLESSIDGVTYYSAGTFTQKTIAAIEGKVFTALGTTARWKLDIGGSTTPKFALSIAAAYRP